MLVKKFTNCNDAVYLNHRKVLIQILTPVSSKLRYTFLGLRRGDVDFIFDNECLFKTRREALQYLYKKYKIYCKIDSSCINETACLIDGYYEGTKDSFLIYV